MAAMDKLKLENILSEYHGGRYDHLPKFMKRRVDALKKIQLQRVEIEKQYHLEVQQLELKYEKLYQPLYEKRYKIISGEHEPTDEECELPSTLSNFILGIDDEENRNEEDTSLCLTEEEEAKLKPDVKGLPSFWLGCMNTSHQVAESLEVEDQVVLAYLRDVRMTYDVESDDKQSYKLEFLFDENPFFTNKVLTKTYYLRCQIDEKEPFDFSGFEVYKSEGCEINWNPGKDVTKRSIVVKQQNKSDGRTREKKKEVDCDSFFCFFSPPQLPENFSASTASQVDESVAAVVAVDFEIGEMFRQSIIPNAVLYYSGCMDDYDDDSDDEEFESDDEALNDGDEDDSDESSESDDSLDQSGRGGKKFGARKGPKDKHC